MSSWTNCGGRRAHGVRAFRRLRVVGEAAGRATADLLTSSRAAWRDRRRAFTCEPLEDRTLLSTYTVTGTGDDAQIIASTGQGTFNASTLRAAVVAANASPGADTINFQSGLSGTITLSTFLEISDTTGSTTIAGPGAGVISVTGSQPLLLIDANVPIAISNITFSGATQYANLPNGGAIRNFGILTLNSVTFFGNQAAGNGGAIDNESSASIIGCTIFANTAAGSGGGIYNAGNLSISSTTIANNIAATGGGIYNDAAINTAAAASLNGSTLSGNSGSAIQSTGALTLVNATVANNSGGGVGALGRNVTITNSTITANTGNSTPVLQAGLYILNGAAVTMNNSIVAGNSAGSPAVAADIAGIVVSTSKRNLVGTGGSGGLTGGGGSGNQVNVSNPGLGTLGNYGGPVQTVPLLSGSNAIDGGTNSLAVDAGGIALTTDARGFPRRSNGTVDKGAYELQSFITVNTTADETTTNSTTSLREAILLANSDSGPDPIVINFDSTVFPVTAPHAIAFTLGIMEFMPRPGQVTTIQGPGASALILSGQNATRLFLIDPSASVSISGATISGGFTSQLPGGGAAINQGLLSLNNDIITANNASNGNGGAIYNSSNLSISGCTVTSNSAISTVSGRGAGGAVFSVGTLSVTNTTFSQNSAAASTGTAGSGGAIKASGTFSVSGGSFTSNTATNSGGALDLSLTQGSLSNVTFTQNSVSISNAAGVGGAVNIASGQLSIIGCTMTGNSAYNAGAIANSGLLTVINSTLSSNTVNAASSGGSGGAIANYNTLTLTQSTISNNAAGGFGAGLENLATANVSLCSFTGNIAQTMGGAIYTAGPFTLSGSTISGNEAVQFGGAGLSSTGTSTIYNCTFALNVSDNYDGGGIMVFSGTTQLTNDTIAANRATNGGGAVVYAPATLNANNTIIAGNTLTNGTTPNDVLGGITGKFNLLATAGSSGLVNGLNGNQVGVNAMLAPLDYYGGGFKTMPLILGSSAIDRGSVALAVDAQGNPIQFDERGEQRFYGNADIGAVEFQPVVLTITDGTDGLILKRDADGQHIDWSIQPDSGKISLLVGESVVVQGTGNEDPVTLDYTGPGNPLPPAIQWNGVFVISGLQGVNPFAGVNMDINRSTLLFKYTSPTDDPIAVLKTAIINAYNGGLWNGFPTTTTGVLGSSAAQLNNVQTTAVGYADSADGLLANRVANTVEVKYTLYGDANLAGAVDFNSFMRLTQHFTQTNAGWDAGDFNFDGVVDTSDFNLLQKNYGTNLASQASGSAVPVALATYAPTQLTSATAATPETSVKTRKSAKVVDKPVKPEVKPPKAVKEVRKSQ